MIDATVHKRIEDKILDVLLLAQSIYNQSFELPTLEYSQMGRVAGRAWFHGWRVELNPDFLKNGHLEDMINVTLPHELAHLISRKVYGDMGAGHSRWWKSVMVRLGLRPDRCHNYSLEGVKTRKKSIYPCKCPTCGKVFNVTRHRQNQILSGVKLWHSDPVCRVVKAPLVMVGAGPL